MTIKYYEQHNVKLGKILTPLWMLQCTDERAARRWLRWPIIIVDSDHRSIEVDKSYVAGGSPSSYKNNEICK